MASIASFLEKQTMAPFPAASPSALTTIGAPSASMYSLAAFASTKVADRAVGMPYLLHSLLSRVRGDESKGNRLHKGFGAFELRSCLTRSER